MLRVGRKGLPATGRSAELTERVDDPATQVSPAEGCRHGEHRKRAHAVGNASSHPRAGDNLDASLAGRDHHEHGGLGPFRAKRSMQSLRTESELPEIVKDEISDQHGNVQAILPPRRLDRGLDALLRADREPRRVTSCHCCLP